MNMKMNIEWHVGVVHFIGATPSRKFKLTTYTPIEEVCVILHEFVPYSDNLKIVKIEYRMPSVDKDGKLVLINHELKNDADMRGMWNTYTSFEEKVLIELDATISRSVDDIIMMLQRPHRH
ncbi:uncharacterized protein LOC131651300 [Vicia villosa]|uniref:uncharacterized protein LOC131651300 n=1 Tax=Vicia villosa TaxID=3911 RepID=UPI00273B1AD4|nr:uncharacterized protein LOC131651300 [Vicia villosa]